MEKEQEEGQSDKDDGLLFVPWWFCVIAGVLALGL